MITGIGALPGLILLTAAAQAAGEAPAAPSEPLFVAQIILLLVVGRTLGELMQRLGQPAIMGQLLAGILLGPSALGAALPQVQHAIFPSANSQKIMIDGVSQLGILLLLLLTGMETDLALIGRLRRAAASVSLAGIGVPFACGVLLGGFMPQAMLPRPEPRLITALFLGTALSISSVKIVAVVVHDMNFLRRTIGQLIVASAIIDDTIGWIIISVIFGLALHGQVEVASLGLSIVGTMVFLALSLTLGQRAVAAVMRWTNDNFVSELPVITAILVIMGVMALITSLIGVHTVLGAFVAGILVGRSPILTQHVRDQLRGPIVALFMPVFFGIAGLTTDLTVLRDPSLLLIAGGLILIASVGKFGGAFLGGTLAGLSRRESLALGCGMNARGSTEVIVATIGLSMGALNQTLYTMIVAMAFVTTMAMPPMLRWALARLPISPEESERLARMAASTANSPGSPRASTGRWRWWWLAALPGATRSAAASTSWCR
jgi:Kef-type K+ transport system membrane component KefB